MLRLEQNKTLHYLVHQHLSPNQVRQIFISSGGCLPLVCVYCQRGKFNLKIICVHLCLPRKARLLYCISNKLASYGAHRGCVSVCLNSGQLSLNSALTGDSGSVSPVCYVGCLCCSGAGRLWSAAVRPSQHNTWQTSSVLLCFVWENPDGRNHVLHLKLLGAVVVSAVSAALTGVKCSTAELYIWKLWTYFVNNTNSVARQQITIRCV